MYDKNTLAAGGVCKLLVISLHWHWKLISVVADKEKYTEEGFYTNSNALIDYNQVRDLRTSTASADVLIALSVLHTS